VSVYTSILYGQDMYGHFIIYNQHKWLHSCSSRWG